MFQLTYKYSYKKIITTFVLIDNNVFNEAILPFYVGYDAGLVRIGSDA